MTAGNTQHKVRQGTKNLLQRVALALCFGIFPAAACAQEKPAEPAKQDEACLACHGQEGMKSEKGEDISIHSVKHAASVHGILACQDCHTTFKDFPHPAKVTKGECSTCHAEEAASVPKSIHAALGDAACSSCHGNVHEIAPPVKNNGANCAECHTEEVKQFAQSAHGRAAKNHDPDAPTCFSCHGPVHTIVAAGDAGSFVAKKVQAVTCAKCHSNPAFLARHQIPIAHPVEQYLQSAHNQAIAQGKNGATCSDCHGSHGILPARDAKSTVSHWNLAKTCGNCHKDIAEVYQQSVHGVAVKAGVQDAPDCADCHGEHLILGPKNPESPVNAGNVSVETCGRCHGDTRLERRYSLPADRVPSYAESFHGLAKREGSLTAANCASCHGVHNIFRSEDPRSTVNAANLAKTCGKCHEGAGEKFAIGRVHVQTSSASAHPVVRWIRGIYWALIPLTLGFMILHNLLDFLAKLVRPRRLPETGRRVVRMNLNFRMAHWGVMLSFPTLVFTGFALKFPDSFWAKPFLIFEGRIAFRSGLHRTAAVVLLTATIYHCIHLALNKKDRALLGAMLPRWKDAKDMAGVFLFNLGKRKEEPHFAKFNYAEKVEYWAFLWGTAVMAVSGFLLWFNNFALRHFPKWVSDAATAVHWYEALLATFSILLWHFYMVIFDPLVYPMDLAWLTGRASADHYEHTRPEYFRTLEKAGLVESHEEKIAPEAALLPEEPAQGKP